MKFRKLLKASNAFAQFDQVEDPFGARNVQAQVP